MAHAVALAPGQMYAEDFDKAVGRAFQNEIELVPTPSGTVFLATSASTPTIRHRTTLKTCSCVGHQTYGYCQHRAKLLFELGPQFMTTWAGIRKDGGFTNWLGLLG